MTRIWYVPIEPLKERYTESWYINIQKYFKDKGVAVQTIDGLALSNKVVVGTFLDINSTVHYKSTQLSEIARMFAEKQVHDGDIFFFGDLEFWGLESVRLMAQMNKVQIKIFGFMHAGSYTREDAFAIASDYQKYTELGWFCAVDKIFVGSNYHRFAIASRRLMSDRSTLMMLTKERADKIIVTGNPMFRNDYENVPVFY